MSFIYILKINDTVVEHTKEVQDLVEKIKTLEASNYAIKAEYEAKINSIEETRMIMSNEASIQLNNMQACQNSADEHIQTLTNELNELKLTNEEFNKEINRLNAICIQYEEHLRNETERLENLLNLKQATIERLNEEIDSLNTSLEEEKLKCVELKEKNENILESREMLQKQYDQQKGYIERLASDHEEKNNLLNQNQISADSELKALVDSKQAINDSLMTELSDLKLVIENQRLYYEEKLSKLVSDIREREEKIADLSMRDESLLQKSVSFDTSVNETPLIESDNMQNLSLTNKCSHLEAQLKYCHEKCEKVVLKLNQLKKQNESLNSKIKSIKSMAFV